MKIIASNKNNNPRVTNIDAHSEMGSETQYNQILPKKIIIPVINEIILKILKTCIIPLIII